MRYIAVEVLVEELLPPVQHLAFVHKKVSLGVPTSVGLRRIAFAGPVNLLVELSRLVLPEQLVKAVTTYCNLTRELNHVPTLEPTNRNLSSPPTPPPLFPACRVCRRSWVGTIWPP
uniref:(northern house mosquito) hypothetical protein n=1 Tax=Culex pipiens TaxID=7175 RepID=A0A8D8GF65_CULPI